MINQVWKRMVLYWTNEHILSFLLVLSQKQRTLAKSLKEFNFECIGSAQTDDEQVISDSLRHFGKLIENIEDERDNMVSELHFIENCWNLMIIVCSYNLHMNKLLNHWRISGRNKLVEWKKTKRNSTKRLRNFVSRKNVF